MTNEELATAIHTAWGYVRASSKVEACHTILEQHLRELVNEQSRRATTDVSIAKPAADGVS